MSAEFENRRPVRPGLYDNQATLRREVWHPGPEGVPVLVQWVTAHVIAAKACPPEWAPWGHYPDIDCEVAA